MSILSLDKFKSSTVGFFEKGTWVVEYHDNTHLPEDTYISLGKVEVEEYTQKGDAFFWFSPHSPDNFKQSILEEWNKSKVQPKQRSEPDSERAAKIIPNQLTEFMVRLGLVQPFFEIYPQFSMRRFATVVLDTNALRNGAIRHLREQFHNIQLWVIVPTVSLMEIGERAANIKRNVPTKEGDYKTQNITFIQTRPQVTVAPQEVKWIKNNFPTETLELAPELLRTFRGYESGTDKEPDRFSINDRLILEGIKDLRRQRGLSEGVYLMSSDKDMSWLAQLEGIHTIYPAMPNFQEMSDGIYSLRYSFSARTYISCSIHRFLWDLTHVFSKIRVRCLSGPQEGRKLELFYYYPTKLVNDWVEDKLEVTDLGSHSSPNTV